MSMNNGIHSYEHWEAIVQRKCLLCLTHAHFFTHTHMVTSQTITIDGRGFVVIGHRGFRQRQEIELLRLL